MPPLQLRRRSQREEELAPVAVFPFIRHSQQPSPVEFKSRVDLILERLAVVECGFASSSCACWVAALDDEVFDEPVEDSVGVVAIEAVLEEVTGG